MYKLEYIIHHYGEDLKQEKYFYSIKEAYDWILQEVIKGMALKFYIINEIEITK